MEKLNNQAARRYLRRVRRLLPCSRTVKDRITAPLRQSLLEYLAEKPDASPEALWTRFGPPEAVAAMCLENTDKAALMKQLLIKRRILRIVSVAVLVSVLLWAGFVTYSYWELRSEVIDGYDVKYIGFVNE